MVSLVTRLLISMLTGIKLKELRGTTQSVGGNGMCAPASHTLDDIISLRKPIRMRANSHGHPKLREQLTTGPGLLDGHSHCTTSSPAKLLITSPSLSTAHPPIIWL